MVAGFRFTLKDGHGRLISELIKIKSQGELVVHTACFVLGDYADRNIKCAKVAQEGFGNGKDDVAFTFPTSGKGPFKASTVSISSTPTRELILIQPRSKNLAVPGVLSPLSSVLPPYCCIAFRPGLFLVICLP